MKAAPPVPLAEAELVMTGMARPMVMVRPWLPVPAAFVAVTVTLKVPDWVGVPEMRPVVGLTVIPVGKVPVTPKEDGGLLAVIWYEKAWPPVPLAVAALVMTGVTRPMVMVSD